MATLDLESISKHHRGEDYPTKLLYDFRRLGIYSIWFI